MFHAENRPQLEDEHKDSYQISMSSQRFYRALFLLFLVVAILFYLNFTSTARPHSSIMCHGYNIICVCVWDANDVSLVTHDEKNIDIHAELPTMTKFLLECRMWCNVTSTLSNGSAQYTQKGRWMDITNWKRKTPWEDHWNVSFCLSFIFAPQTHSYTTIYVHIYHAKSSQSRNDWCNFLCWKHF